MKKKWQQWFNTVIAGFRAQDWAKSGKDASSDGIVQYVCLYRGPNGCKCAIGHLISDEAAEKGDRKNLYAGYLVSIGAVEGAGEEDIAFLANMQRAHDQSTYGGLEDAMRLFAQECDLQWPEAEAG